MTLEDVKTIQLALDELGIAMLIVDDPNYLFTLHQRRLYEKATHVLNNERERLNGHGSEATSAGKIQLQA
jgi:hypothetical protein